MKKNLNQEKIINSEKNLMVIASAGCGKTYTITKKIDKILKKVSPSEILVISFTNETVNDLKKKLHQDIHIKTFHKLAMLVLEKNNSTYYLTSDELLELITNDFFENLITKKDKFNLMKYFFIFNYNDLLKSKIFLDFKNVIYTFIKLMHCNNFNFNFLKTVFKNEKDKFLISIIMKIYYLYNKEKKDNNLIDLDDLIITAGECAKKQKFNYKYIFVDEFQDTSEIRFNLIYNIFRNSNSIINFFGDDFQSIYAFSGCNLSIMLNIKDKIPDIETLYLDQNFRSDNHLINSANNFVLKNPYQLTKKVSSNITILNSINYIYYKNYKEELFKLINKLELITDDIMFLGRYKNDFKIIPDKYRKLTIHESKGLEAKFVVILNLKDATNGFPSKIKNHHLLNYFDNSENFSFAEERRIFYVAITRAKEKVFLFIPKVDKSIFIKEFKKIEKMTK
ncbi:MAG: UvrD-helicase domain-containing protein [bacterium]